MRTSSVTVVISVFVREVLNMNVKIFLLPETYTTFLIQQFTYGLGCHGNDGRFATTRLSMNHQGVPTWTPDIIFNFL